MADDNVVEMNLHDDDQPTVYVMPCGLRDPNQKDVFHKEFTLREITGRDEEAIHKADVRTNGARLSNVLLARCITSIGPFTPKSMGTKWPDMIKSLYGGDIDYIMMQLRILSLGKEVETNHECPECKTKLTTTFDLDEIEVIPFQQSEIPFSLRTGYIDRKGAAHKEGVMTLPTGFDREVLIPVARTNLAKAETLMLSRVCKFNDGTLISDEVMGDLTMRDRDYLQQLQKDYQFGPKLTVEVECDQCGHAFKGSLNAVNFL